MSVSLKIVAFKGLPYAAGEPVIIDRTGGTLGRSDTCNLVLPDTEKVVSRRHATVSYENDAFVLSDTSLGGTYVDGNPAAINNSAITLVDGMVLQIGEYRIQVNLVPESNASISVFPDIAMHQTGLMDTETSPFAGDGDDALLNPPNNTDHFSSLISENTVATDPANVLLMEPENSVVPAPESNEIFSPLHDSFIPPSPTGERHANDEMPDDFNFEDLFTLDSTAEEVQPVTPNIEPAEHNNGRRNGNLSTFSDEMPPKTDVAVAGIENLSLVTEPKQPGQHPADLYRSFLQGAALHQDDIPITQQEGRIRHIGSMFRQFVESTVAVLRNRAEFKSLFRVTVTTIKKADNNPLKFSVTTDEALQHLLNDRQGGFKKSVDAIAEGFQDILNHQMAMQAGIQASLQEILSQFEPDRIERKFEDGLVLNKKAKCWDRYSEVYARLAEKAVEDFYGDVFAEAYEKQMRQISAVNQQQNMG